jgi:hypothetical protein
MTATTTKTQAEKNEHARPERRQARRYRCLSECLVRLEGAAEPLDWPGMVYNISATGIGLALPFPALPGLLLVIEPRRRRSAGLRLRAQVVRCGLQEYVWFHGCEFVTPLGAEELGRWLAELGAGRSQDD